MHARNDLANCRAELGEAAEAVAALERLLADRRRILGDQHPHALVTEHDLAVRRGRLDGPATAVTELERLLAERTRTLGPEHPYTRQCAASLEHWRNQ
jgi:hypothetical protein